MAIAPWGVMEQTRIGYVPPDPAKIEIDNPEALHFWARSLSTDEDKVRQAVGKVGPMLDKVKTELGIGGVG